MDGNDGSVMSRILDLERRIRELEEKMKREAERLQEELTARGLK